MPVASVPHYLCGGRHRHVIDLGQDPEFISARACSDGNGSSPRCAAISSIPIWYGYRPGGPVRVITGQDSRTARAIQAGGWLSLCAPGEAWGKPGSDTRIAGRRLQQ